MAIASDSMPRQRVLIIGGGLVGLTAAQGLKRRGIEAVTFERSPNTGGRTEGWAITLHWALNALESMIPPELAAQLADTTVDGTLQKNEGHFLLLDGRDLRRLIDTPPSVRRVRANRSKLRALLMKGLQIEYNKQFVRYELIEGGVRAFFSDGTSSDGTLLIGCDGDNSAVRTQLLGVERTALHPVDVRMYGGTRILDKEFTAKLRAIDPLFFQTIDPTTQTFMWFSCQQLLPDGRMECLSLVSHLITDLTAELPDDATNAEMVRDMKYRTKDWAEPLFSLINEFPEDQPVSKVSIRDWIPPPFNNAGKGRVTLAGDAAGPMTMYRGEGVNHGMLDAANLVEHLLHVEQGKLTLDDALEKYDAEVRERRELAVPLSRQAALDAHADYDPNSPLVSRRAGPPSAQRVFDDL